MSTIFLNCELFRCHLDKYNYTLNRYVDGVSEINVGNLIKAINTIAEAVFFNDDSTLSISHTDINSQTDVRDIAMHILIHDLLCSMLMYVSDFKQIVNVEYFKLNDSKLIKDLILLIEIRELT